MQIKEERKLPWTRVALAYTCGLWRATLLLIVHPSLLSLSSSSFDAAVNDTETALATLTEDPSLYANNANIA